jgi:hypothetical protein
MSGSLGYNQQKSQQSSASTSGISNDYKDDLSEDAYRESQKYGQAAASYASSPFGYFQGQHVSQLMPQNEFGLPIQTTQALTSLANQWYSKASAGGAMRGQVTPYNTNQVVGSALTSGAQFLAPYIMQNQQYLAELPDKLAASRLSYLQGSQATKASLLGSQSVYQGDSSGFGFRVAGGMGQGNT